MSGSRIPVSRRSPRHRGGRPGASRADIDARRGHDLADPVREVLAGAPAEHHLGQGLVHELGQGAEEVLRAIAAGGEDEAWTSAHLAVGVGGGAEEAFGDRVGLSLKGEGKAEDGVGRAHLGEDRDGPRTLGGDLGQFLADRE